jgi:hypothetical protein
MEYLRGLYRALGLGEQTLERAIKAGKQPRPPSQNKELSEPADPASILKRRERRGIKAPREIREMRGDQPKPKG